MDTKDLLLENALRLFSERGFDSVGVQEIVLLSGVTKPTLYHFFTNKHGLLRALLDRHYTPFLSTLKTAAAYTSDLRGTLSRTASVFYREAEANPQFMRLRMTLDFVPRENEIFEICRPYTHRVFTLLSGIFESAAEHHGNMRGRHTIHAASYLGLVHTLVSLYLSGDIRLDDSYVDEALRFFLHGIFSQDNFYRIIHT